MAEAIDLKSPEYLAKRVLQLELEAEGHKQTISRLKHELSEREKIFDEQDAFIQRTNECLGHLAEGFYCPKEIVKAIDGDKLVGKHVSNNDIRHSALVDSHVYVINFLRAFGINEATLSMLCQLILAMEELPLKLKDEFMFQVSREKSPLPEGGKYKGGGKNQVALAKAFKSRVAACYQYLKDNKLEAGDPQTIVATACGYVADPGKVLDIYTEVMASTDKIFLSQYRKALSSLKNMPPDTPRQNVKRALDWELKRTPENLVRKPPSKS